jgi:hypothetical protein
MNMMRWALVLAMVVLGSILQACVSLSQPAPVQSELRDLDSGSPLSGVIVVGVFGYELNDLHHAVFQCSGVEAVVTDASGRFSFATSDRPWDVYAYKEGYWQRYPNPVGRTFGMTRKDPILRLDPARQREAEADPRWRTPLLRRLDTSRQIFLKCSADRNKSVWRELRPLHIAMAREALAFGQTEEETALAIDLCRRVANEGDDGGRVAGMGGKFVYTGLEARRLEAVVPECLSADLLLRGMRRAMQGTARSRALTRGALLERAIVERPADYAKRIVSDRGTTIGCGLPGAHHESLNCNLTMNASERFPELIEKVRDAGIPYALDQGCRCLRFRGQDMSTVSRLLKEVLSDL